MLRKYLIHALPILLFGSALWFALLHYGNRQFLGMDAGVLVDAGWRMTLGQRPYVDFPTAVPPALLLLGQVALAWFGPVWSSFLKINAVCGILFIAFADYMLLRLGVACVLRWFFLAASVTATLLVTGFVWYNALSALALVLFLLSVCVLFRDPHDRINRFCFVLTLIILSWMKPNYAASMVAVVFITAQLDRRLRGTVALFTGVGTASLRSLF